MRMDKSSGTRAQVSQDFQEHTYQVMARRLPTQEISAGSKRRAAMQSGCKLKPWPAQKHPNVMTGQRIMLGRLLI